MNRRDFLAGSLASLAATSAAASQNNNTFNNDAVAFTRDIRNYNIDFSGKNDSTGPFQTLLNDMLEQSKSLSNAQQKVRLMLQGVVQVSSTIKIDASKVSIHGPLTIIFTKNGNFDNYAIVVTGNPDVDAAYSNIVDSFFSGVHFISEKRTLDLFFAYNPENNSNRNASCLLSIYSCRFTGFRRVFSNGAGGWGWNWFSCGFNNCDRLLYLTRQPDSYERFTFIGCIWQNGGYAFEIDNPDGVVYWQAGSFDYCEGIALINEGHVEINGHVEYVKRKQPVVVLRKKNASFVFNGGAIFVRQNPEQPYVIFDQAFDYQTTLTSVRFATDGINVTSCVISNRPCWKNNLIFTNQMAELIALNDNGSTVVYPGAAGCACRYDPAHIKEDNGRFVKIAASDNVQLQFLIPVNGHDQIGVVWQAQTSATNKVAITKALHAYGENGPGPVMMDLTRDGKDCIQRSDQLQKGSSGTLWKVPRSAWLFALSFNLSSASVGDYLDMHELKLISC
ncbi:hypothetical protein J8657_14930 [Dickeya oryzae]|uniref:Uncharacterized protein n=1 Tax=Dickeya oryzae TaxID=1240404 RepID=A0AB39IJX2_9GAMM|nr:hypothetical protein [Dickeya oryzae]MBP2858896.1 hypothetical protein [Dickeya oryzae]MCA6992397.1 hypothetical protein [Dickeya oryzae]